MQRGLRENCATIPFTFCFWVNFIIITILHGFISESYEVMRVLGTVTESDSSDTLAPENTPQRIETP